MAPKDRFDPRAGCVLDWQLWRIIVRHCGAVMFAAKRKVGFIAAYLHLIAGRDGFASAVKSHDHCRLLAAMADGPYLAHFISQRQKRGGSRKQLTQKIYSQAIAHDGQAKVIDHAGQGPNLFLGQKLRFINKAQATGPCASRFCIFSKRSSWVVNVSASSPMPMREAILP